MTPKIRILIADDHPIVRDGLVAILGTQPDFDVVGEAANGTELIDRAAALHPDLILTDLEMPGLDGVDAIRQIHSASPTVQIVVLTAFNTDDRIIGSIQALETIKVLLDLGDPLVGRLLAYDALEESFRTFKVRRDPACPTCGEHAAPIVIAEYDEHCLPHATPPSAAS